MSDISVQLKDVAAPGKNRMQLNLSSLAGSSSTLAHLIPPVRSVSMTTTEPQRKMAVVQNLVLDCSNDLL